MKGLYRLIVSEHMVHHEEEMVVAGRAPSIATSMWGGNSHSDQLGNVVDWKQDLALTLMPPW